MLASDAQSIRVRGATKSPLRGHLRTRGRLALGFLRRTWSWFFFPTGCQTIRFSGRRQRASRPFPPMYTMAGFSGMQRRLTRPITIILSRPVTILTLSNEIYYGFYVLTLCHHSPPLSISLFTGRAAADLVNVLNNSRLHDFGELPAAVQSAFLTPHSFKNRRAVWVNRIVHFDAPSRVSFATGTIVLPQKHPLQPPNKPVEHTARSRIDMPTCFLNFCLCDCAHVVIRSLLAAAHRRRSS